MRKIRLSDTDLELFDIEIGPDDYTYYQRHKDAFKTMWRQQGKPFWTRFQITFRSFTVKHGVIKHMNIDSPKFQNILDEAFIFIHEQFVDGKESTARNFIDDVARLAQNQDKFPALDSKSFSKDPFFTRDTRELFRKFFGQPDQKSSYLKVYILCPVYLRFGGSVCRCLIRWMEADTMLDPSDESYWIPPQSQATDKISDETVETTMCSKCVDDCGTKYFQEKIMGKVSEPVSLSFWTIGDPRFNDSDNPLFAPHLDPNEDWRNLLNVDLFRDFYNYAKFKYGEGCSACTRLKKKRDKVIHVCKAGKKKKKQPKTEQELLIQDLREVRDKIDEFEDNVDKAPEYEECIHDMIKDKPRLKEFFEESGIKPPGADRRAAEEDRNKMMLKLQAEKDKKEIEMRALLAYERQSNFTKQIGSIKLCKHLVGDKEAEAHARELDRRNREKSLGDPNAKCTCPIGRRAIMQKSENHAGVPANCLFDLKTIAKIRALQESSSENSSVSSDSRDSSVEKIVVNGKICSTSEKDDSVEAKDDDCLIKDVNKQKNDVNGQIVEQTIVTDESSVELNNTDRKDESTVGVNVTEKNDTSSFEENNTEKNNESSVEVNDKEKTEEKSVEINDEESNEESSVELNDSEKDDGSSGKVNDAEKSDDSSVELNDVEMKLAEAKDIREVVNDVSEEEKFPIQELAGRDIEVQKNGDTVQLFETLENDTHIEEPVAKSYGKLIADKFPIQEQAGREQENKNIPEINFSSKRSLFSEKDLTSGKNIVSGFKVIKIEDQENNLYEVNVSAACVKSDEEENEHNARMKKILQMQELNSFILSANVLREKIPGLPQRLEWWEGRGFAVAIVNYEEEEKELSKHWTHFTLKINGYDELAIKRTMLQLLIYVSKRKRRICRGWNMEVDDVVACILPEESSDIEDLSISISRGFRFEDRLTEFEKTSLLKHYPSLNLTVVLCGIEKGAAVKTMERKSGRDKLRKVIEFVAEKEIFTKDLPVVDVVKLCKKLNKDEVTKADILWEQLIRKPDKFEMFVLLDKEQVLAQTEWWNLGMRNTDIRLYNNTKDLPKICPMCKTAGLDCLCEQMTVVEPKVVELVERTDYDKVKILGDENGPDLGKMKYTETNLSMDNKNEKLDKKQLKAIRKKEKRIELPDLPAKFAEAGIDADKTMITIPNYEQGPMLGKVPIPGADKNEKLAPIPGVQSSLNFTFQSGKKEQTITVTLGAYMPEEKINEMQEKKDLLRLIEEEEKRRNIQAIPAAENFTNEKKEKKKKKEKAKAKSAQAFGTDGAESKSTKIEKNELTTKFLEEILCDEEKVKSVKKQMNQHMGLSNRNYEQRPELFIDESIIPKCTCPDHDAIFEMVRKRPLPRSIAEKDRRIQEAVGITEVINRKGKKKITQIQIDKSPDKCQCGKCEVEAIETFGIEIREKKEKRKVKKKPVMTEAVNKVKAASTEVDKSVADSIPDEEIRNNVEVLISGSKSSNGNKGARKKTAKKMREDEEDLKDQSDIGKDGSSDEKEGRLVGSLRTCGNCQKIEPSRRAFKKCQKCKDEGVLEVRYYCSRECQVDDWKTKHKMEHKDGLLG